MDSGETLIICICLIYNRVKSNNFKRLYLINKNSFIICATRHNIHCQLIHVIFNNPMITNKFLLLVF